MSIVCRVELILSDEELEGSCNKVVGVDKVEFACTVLETYEDVCLSLLSRIAEVNVVPVNKVLLIRNSLPVVWITVTIQVSIAVSGECHDMVGHLITNEEGECSISQ